MRRIDGIDGLRGVAIVLVLVWHYVAIGLPSGGPALTLVARVLSITWSGVDLFFVLSGFLIVGVLLDAKESASYFKTFYVRRIFRILPLYYLMLVLFWFVPLWTNLSSPWLLAKEWPTWAYWTFTQNFFMQEMGFGPQWLSVTWSLAIEEQFYLLVPWLVKGLRRRNLVILFVVGFVTAPIWRSQLSPLAAYVLPQARADALCVGGLIAIAYRNKTIWPMILAQGKLVLGAAGLVSVAVMHLVSKKAGVGDVYLHTLLALFGGLIVLLILIGEDHGINRILRTTGLRWFGQRSYGIFLFHLPALGLLRQVCGHNPIPELASWPDVWLALAALLGTLALSEFSHRYFENKMYRLGRRLS